MLSRVPIAMTKVVCENQDVYSEAQSYGIDTANIAHGQNMNRYGNDRSGAER